MVRFFAVSFNLNRAIFREEGLLMAVAAPLLHKDIRTSSNTGAGLLNRSISTGLSTHLLVEMWRARFSSLASAENIRIVLEQAHPPLHLNGAEKARIRVFQFDPYGVSGTATSSTIHILIHTWPEKGYAAMDIFARDHDNAHEALERIKARLSPGNIHVMELARGKLLEMEDT